MSQFDYDKGKLIQVLDANLNSTSYEYDNLKRLTTVHHPSGATSSYTYYFDSLLKTKTDGKGQTKTSSPMRRAFFTFCGRPFLPLPGDT